MSSRRSHGEGSIFFEEARNRWVGTIDLETDGSGRRRRSKITGTSKTEVRKRLDALRHEAAAGLPVANGSMTFGQLLDDWMTTAVPARVKSSNTAAQCRWAVEST